MSNHPQSVASAAPSLVVGAWDLRRPLADARLRKRVFDAQVVGVGESAHFVAECNAARATLVASLIQDAGIGSIALEVGRDEAPSLEQWLAGERPEELQTLVGPLTTALYGSFLEDLRQRLPKNHGVQVLGVDLPNSLSLKPSVAPLVGLLDKIDPSASELVQKTRELAEQVEGGSAAASAASWLALERDVQDSLTVHLARLRARVDALAAVHRADANAHLWQEASALTEAAATTDVMLRAMADLFSNEGRIDDTTIREVYVARRIEDAVQALADGERIAYVAHNNHIQKTPVLFDGFLTAYPAGSLLDGLLGTGYCAIALSSANHHVPEMAFPASTEVGFRVELVGAAALNELSVEAACTDVLQSAPSAMVLFEATEDARPMRMRSQSATTEITAGTFDAALVLASATMDAALTRLGLG